MQEIAPLNYFLINADRDSPGPRLCDTSGNFKWNPAAAGCTGPVDYRGTLFRFGSNWAKMPVPFILEPARIFARFFSNGAFGRDVFDKTYCVQINFQQDNCQCRFVNFCWSGHFRRQIVARQLEPMRIGIFHRFPSSRSVSRKKFSFKEFFYFEVCKSLKKIFGENRE